MLLYNLFSNDNSSVCFYNNYYIILTYIKLTNLKLTEVSDRIRYPDIRGEDFTSLKGSYAAGPGLYYRFRRGVLKVF